MPRRALSTKVPNSSRLGLLSPATKCQGSPQLRTAWTHLHRFECWLSPVLLAFELSDIGMRLRSAEPANYVGRTTGYNLMATCGRGTKRQKETQLETLVSGCPPNSLLIAVQNLPTEPNASKRKEAGGGFHLISNFASSFRPEK